MCLYLSLIARISARPASISPFVLNIPTHASMVFLRSSRTCEGLSLPPSRQLPDLLLHLLFLSGHDVFRRRQPHVPAGIRRCSRRRSCRRRSCRAASSRQACSRRERSRRRIRRRHRSPRRGLAPGVRVDAPHGIVLARHDGDRLDRWGRCRRSLSHILRMPGSLSRIFCAPRCLRSRCTYLPSSFSKPLPVSISVWMLLDTISLGASSMAFGT